MYEEIVYEYEMILIGKKNSFSGYFFNDTAEKNERKALHVIDFAIKTPEGKVAIEVDGNTWHDPQKISDDKYHDDLLKQNSMVHLGWDVYRWAVRQMQIQPEAVKDELRVFLGNHPQFKEIEDYLPPQRGKAWPACCRRFPDRSGRQRTGSGSGRLLFLRPPAVGGFGGF